jgi:hypothetical protein
MGCENSSITDPNSADIVGKNESSIESIAHRGSIPLDRMLMLPGRGNDYYQIKGTINYTSELIRQFPYLNNEKYNVKLAISVKALLSDIYSKSWSISSDSEDLIYIAQDGIYVLEKPTL